MVLLTKVTTVPAWGTHKALSVCALLACWNLHPFVWSLSDLAVAWPKSQAVMGTESEGPTARNGQCSVLSDGTWNTWGSGDLNLSLSACKAVAPTLWAIPLLLSVVSGSLASFSFSLSALLSQVLDWALLGNSAACDPMVPSLALLLALSCAQFEFSFPAGQWELCQGRVAIQRPQGAGLSWGVWCRDSEPREHVTLQLGLEPTALTASLSQ